MSEDTGRITVSRDALRAELATLELRLVERLATKAEVTALEGRVTSLEASGSPSAQELEIHVAKIDEALSSIQTWQARLAGATAVVATICGAALPIIFRHYF